MLQNEIKLYRSSRPNKIIKTVQDYKARYNKNIEMSFMYSIIFSGLERDRLFYKNMIFKRVLFFFSVVKCTLFIALKRFNKINLIRSVC